MRAAPPAPASPWEAGLEREWLVADGLGSFASGTVGGPHTRRYHGLLVAALSPPAQRTLLLSRLEETLTVGGRTFPLSTNEFADGTIAPEGFRNLAGFALEGGLPVWRYALDAPEAGPGGAGRLELQKRVWMPGPRTTAVAYTLLRAPGPAHLALVPLCAYRDMHHHTTGSEDWRFGVERGAGGLTVRAFAGATPYHLLVDVPAGRDWEFEGPGGWWWRFLHRTERARGQDDLDDLYAAGTIGYDLRPGETLLLLASTESPEGVLGLAPALRREVATALNGTTSQGAAGAAEEDEQLGAQLRRAAGQFLVARPDPGAPLARRPDGAPGAQTVIAGYHWFGDWGRDTMIALPGLAAATGRWEEAGDILRAFARYVDQGMLPNRFPDSGAPLSEADYNTADATLWYVRAVDVVDRALGGTLIEALLPVLQEIVEWHVRGTRYGIGVDPQDGLLRIGNGQLTWMDAQIGDWIVTPRDGKPVELAALWHHALGLMAGWASRRGQSAPGGAVRRAAGAGGRGLPAALLVRGRGLPVRRGGCPPGGRLQSAPQPGHRRRPAGLPADGGAAPGGGGGGAAGAVDAPRAAHPGPRRPPLRGALRRRPSPPATPPTTGAPSGPGCWAPWWTPTCWPTATARRRGPWWPPCGTHLLAEAGCGSVSELFDGDPPHAPGGCIAQAWSVAEVFRAWQATAAPSAPTLTP